MRNFEKYHAATRLEGPYGSDGLDRNGTCDPAVSALGVPEMFTRGSDDGSLDDISRLAQSACCRDSTAYLPRPLFVAWLAQQRPDRSLHLARFQKSGRKSQSDAMMDDPGGDAGLIECYRERKEGRPELERVHDRVHPTMGDAKVSTGKHGALRCEVHDPGGAQDFCLFPIKPTAMGDEQLHIKLAADSGGGSEKGPAVPLQRAERHEDEGLGRVDVERDVLFPLFFSKRTDHVQTTSG